MDNKSLYSGRFSEDMKNHSDDMWTIFENEFNEHFLGKCETTMALGNGYLGIRSVTEESYVNEKRNFFIAGTFNKADSEEVTELPNIPDVINMDIKLNGVTFNLDKGTQLEYQRTLNLQTGEMIRKIFWETEETGKVEIEFRRFASMHDKHLIGQRLSIFPLEKELSVTIQSGINGQVTNSGAQHFIEGVKRLYDKKIMHMAQKTCESKIDVILNTVHIAFLEDEKIESALRIHMDRRKIFGEFEMTIPVKTKYHFEKLTTVGTSRDIEFEGLSYEELHQQLLTSARETMNKGYIFLLNQSETAWRELLWGKSLIQLDSVNREDALAIKFAQYHLQIMTPVHDERMGIGAKGLTGEGYKGHSFWDTEIFILPYFLYTNPDIAKKLLKYRFNTLSGARKKAAENKYFGAMFPWESAWVDDGEVTPVWGAADIVTGKATKIWSGFIEQHNIADIAFAIWQYFVVTQDLEFMENYGYQILFETAIFWASRIEWNEIDQKYHINNVVGPDEYKEHVNDNAFTNYLVKLNFDLAIRYSKELAISNIDLYNQLDLKINLAQARIEWDDKVNKLFLPQVNEALILPQDSSFLSKQIIDLTKYKNQKYVGTIFQDYNLDQVNAIQVLKQSDVMMLFYLREELFSKEVKLANWNYYEPKTLHDSSLSLSTHSIIANDLDSKDLSYELFQKCRDIDFGSDKKSSDHGIHAAALGGMLQCVINGFGGVRILDNKLRIEPKLPKQWKKIVFSLFWRGDELKICIEHHMLTIENSTQKNKMIEFLSRGNTYILCEKINISY